MPGITGILSKRPIDASMLQTMVKSMVHEPFYVNGTFMDERLGVAAGWVCHAGSYSDCLPVWNEEKNVCLIFFGENFADRSEIEALKSKGHRFNLSDASVLVHWYEELGDGFVKQLNGWFSGVLLDLREQKVILFNDRYGLGRIYLHQNLDGFFFASEAKALLQALPHLHKFDSRGLGEFFSCGCALQQRTLFEGISQLPPGSSWTLRVGQPIERASYFQKEEWEQLEQLPPEEYYQQLKETFGRILPRYFAGPESVGLSLTGGLDSRMILAGAPRGPETLPCYTFGGMYRECEDVKVGRQVARVCRQPHHIIPVDQSFFPEFLQAARRCVYVTDGAMDVSGAVDVFVNRQAREFAPVRMTGNYGSEILRLNVAFKPMPLDFSMLNPELAEQARVAAVTYAQERDERPLSFIAFKQVPWHHYCRFAEESSQLIIRSPYLDNELVRLAYQSPTGLLLNKQLALRYCAELKPELASVPTDRGVLDRPAIVPEKIYRLWKERWPKAEYYFDYGMPQWLAKMDKLLAPLRLENYFLGQQKFFHFRTWYRHQLAPFVREILLDSATLTRPYLNSRRVQQMVAAHTAGTGNYTLEIHKLLTCELIQRLLLTKH